MKASKSSNLPLMSHPGRLFFAAGSAVAPVAPRAVVVETPGRLRVVEDRVGRVMALREDVPITDLLSAAEDVLRRLEDEAVADVAVVPVLRAVTVLRAATPTAVLAVVVREEVVVASTVVSSLSRVLFLSRSVEVAVRLVMLPNGARYIPFKT